MYSLKTVVSRLNAKKAMGLDGVPCKLLKLASSIVVTIRPSFMIFLKQFSTNICMASCLKHFWKNQIPTAL